MAGGRTLPLLQMITQFLQHQYASASGHVVHHDGCLATRIHSLGYKGEHRHAACMACCTLQQDTPYGRVSGGAADLFKHHGDLQLQVCWDTLLDAFNVNNFL